MSESQIQTTPETLEETSRGLDEIQNILTPEIRIQIEALSEAIKELPVVTFVIGNSEIEPYLEYLSNPQIQTQLKLEAPSIKLLNILRCAKNASPELILECLKKIILISKNKDLKRRLELIWFRINRTQISDSVLENGISPKSVIRALFKIKKLLMSSGIDLSKYGLAKDDIKKMISSHPAQAPLHSLILVLRDILSKLDKETLVSMASEIDDLKVTLALEDFDNTVLQDAANEFDSETEVAPILEINSTDLVQIDGIEALKLEQGSEQGFEDTSDTKIEDGDLQPEKVETDLSKVIIGFELGEKLEKRIEEPDKKLLEIFINIAKESPEYRVLTTVDTGGSPRSDLNSRIKQLISSSEIINKHRGSKSGSDYCIVRCIRIIKILEQNFKLTEKGLTLLERDLLVDKNFNPPTKIFILVQSLLFESDPTALGYSIQRTNQEQEGPVTGTEIVKTSKLADSQIAINNFSPPVSFFDATTHRFDTMIDTLQKHDNLLKQIKNGQAEIGRKVLDLQNNRANLTDDKDLLYVFGSIGYLEEYISTIHQILGGKENYEAAFDLVTKNAIQNSKFNLLRASIDESYNLINKLKTYQRSLDVEGNAYSEIYFMSNPLVTSNGTISEYYKAIENDTLNEIKSKLSTAGNLLEPDRRAYPNIPQFRNNMSLDDLVDLYQYWNLRRLVGRGSTREFRVIFPELNNYFAQHPQQFNSQNPTILAHCLCESLNRNANHLLDSSVIAPAGVLLRRYDKLLYEFPDLCDPDVIKELYGTILKRAIRKIVENMEYEPEIFNLFTDLYNEPNNDLPKSSDILKSLHDWWASTISSHKQTQFAESLNLAILKSDQSLSDYLLNLIIAKFAMEIETELDKVDDVEITPETTLINLIDDSLESLGELKDIFLRAVLSKEQLVNGNKAQVQTYLDRLSVKLHEAGLLESDKFGISIYEPEIFARDSKIVFKQLSRLENFDIASLYEDILGDTIEEENQFIPSNMEEFANWYHTQYPNSVGIMWSKTFIDSFEHLPNNIRISLVAKFKIIGDLSHENTAPFPVRSGSALMAYTHQTESPLTNMHLKVMTAGNKTTASFPRISYYASSSKITDQNTQKMCQFRLSGKYRVQFYLVGPGNYLDHGKIEKDCIWISEIGKADSTH